MDFDIDYGADGKPLFSHVDLQFSVSHSADEMVVAFCSNTAIGIDIESGVRLQNPLAIAERYFSAEEYEFLQQTEKRLLRNTFLRLWVCKEAALKSSGHGLSGGLTTTSVRFDVESRVAIHRGVDGKQLTGLEFILAEGFRGALVAESAEYMENVKWFVLS
ncbi:MAG: 4'-phosphopantetheinyl transferase superfamily protein [Chthoniobacterales bacterium]